MNGTGDDWKTCLLLVILEAANANQMIGEFESVGRSMIMIVLTQIN